MRKNTDIKAILLAFFAALFYGIHPPVSKLLMEQVPPKMMAALLYLGAGLGVGILYLFHYRLEDKATHLTKKDFPTMAVVILLDILAPIFMMTGIKLGSASNASLLGNVEIVTTSLIALFLFGEKITPKLWIAIVLIALAGAVLSFEGSESFSFSAGSLFVILATCCWGLENNCTRRISGKSTFQIVFLNGVFSGTGALITAFLFGETLPSAGYVLGGLLLGFVAYGLSICLYIRAQRTLGAAKTSAYYAVAPFIGALLSFLVNGEKLTAFYFAGLIIMIAGAATAVSDTLSRKEP